ncbi:Rne/Rng family ribonuclease [Rubrivirga sp.]|uniref:Rne/Rng family ribonuclease n=1 Tax=Rubrivirga sp. TaxID=1885344 RepID=UPI003B51EBF9
MKKQIVINASKDRSRIAIVENDELVELYVEHPDNVRTIGNVYLGRVQKVMPAIRAAFVDVGQKQDCFLHFSDLTDNLPQLLALAGEDVPGLDEPVLSLAPTKRVADDEDEPDVEDTLEVETPEPESATKGRSRRRSRGRGRNRGRRGGGREEEEEQEEGRRRLPGVIDLTSLAPSRSTRRAEPEPEDDETAEAPAADAPDADRTDGKAEDEPKARRRGRKKAEESTEAPADEPSADAGRTEDAASDDSDEETDKPSRRRRRRRRGGRGRGKGSNTETDAATDDDEGPTDEDAKATSSRRGRSRKKDSADSATTPDDASAADDAPAADDSERAADEAPTRSRRSKKSDAPADDDRERPGDDRERPGDVSPTGRSRRPAQPATADDAPADDTPAEPEPKPDAGARSKRLPATLDLTGASRSSSRDDTPDDDAGDDAPTDETSGRSRRRSRGGRSNDEATDPADDSAGDTGSRSRGRSKKDESKKDEASSDGRSRRRGRSSDDASDEASADEGRSRRGRRSRGGSDSDDDGASAQDASGRSSGDDSSRSGSNGRSSDGRDSRGGDRRGRSSGRSSDRSSGRSSSGSIPPNEELLKRSGKIIVKITKEAISTKGPRVSTDLSLAGRFLVLVPAADYVAVSKKIESAKERRRLRTLATSLKPDRFGVIVRTVAEGRDAKSLDTDLRLLVDKWRKIEKKLNENPEPPVLLYQDVNMVSSVIRDLFSEDYDRILVDDPKVFKNVQAYVKAVAPSMADKVELHQGRSPVFRSLGIETQVEEAFSKRVNMRGGGYLYIETTEAMHVVDVNSGRAGRGKSQKQNLIDVNVEAAREVAKQLRLRDLGGIIVVDFIDLKYDRDRKKVTDALKEAFARDRAVTKLLPMSDFGLVQITRQRLRPSITTQATDENGDPLDAADAVEAAGAGEIRRQGQTAYVEPEPAATPEPATERPVVAVEDATPRALAGRLRGWLDHYRQTVDEKYKRRPIVVRVHPLFGGYLRRGFPSPLTRWRLSLRGISFVLEEDATVDPLAFDVRDQKSGRSLVKKYSER